MAKFSFILILKLKEPTVDIEINDYEYTKPTFKFSAQ